MSCFVVSRSLSAMANVLHLLKSHMMCSSICLQTLLCPGFCLLWYAFHQVWSNVILLLVWCYTLLCPGLCLLWQTDLTEFHLIWCGCLSASVLYCVPIFVHYDKYCSLSLVKPSVVLGLLLYELWVVVYYVFAVLLLMSRRSQIYHVPVFVSCDIY